MAGCAVGGWGPASASACGSGARLPRQPTTHRSASGSPALALVQTATCGVGDGAFALHEVAKSLPAIKAGLKALCPSLFRVVYTGRSDIQAALLRTQVCRAAPLTAGLRAGDGASHARAWPALLGAGLLVSSSSQPGVSLPLLASACP